VASLAHGITSLSMSARLLAASKAGIRHSLPKADYT